MQVRLPYRPGEKEDWESSGYKIFINADHSSGERIDLPGDLIQINNYAATLGHKMNHNFDYNCREWFCDHPRHGIIPCALADRNIQQVITRLNQTSSETPFLNFLGPFFFTVIMTF